MGQADIWMPIYVGDYIAATQCLDAEESGCYLHLLMSSWIDGPLPTEYKKLMRLARLHGEIKSVVLDEILGKYFELTEDGYVNKRLEEERSKAQGRSAEATRKARLRWDSAKPVENTGNAGADATAQAEAMPRECSSPSPSPSPIQSEKKEEAVPAIVAPTLHKSIEKAFLSKVGRFTDYGKEGKAIKGLIKKFSDLNADDPNAVANQVISKYYDLRTKDKFFGEQPFTPSALNSSGIFDRVMVRFENKADQVDPEIAAYYQEKSA